MVSYEIRRRLAMWEIGHFEIRGFAKMQRLFELPPQGL